MFKDTISIDDKLIINILNFLRTPVFILFVSILIFLPGNVGNVFGETVIALVSKDIRPYREALHGFDNVIRQNEGVDLRILFLDKFEGKEIFALNSRIMDNNPHMLVSIGPEAASYFLNEFHECKIPLIYSMVLNPDTLLGASEDTCGVSLNIPVTTQLSEISRTIPAIRRIGLLYNPAYNAPFFMKAGQTAKLLGMEILPLQISHTKDIPHVLQEKLKSIDALWLIPDRTIKSGKLFQFIIKKALLRNVPVIGYNRFFLESGALLSFVIDYERLGEQTADLVWKTISEKTCKSPAPVFSTMVNYRVAEKLNIPVKEPGDLENDKAAP